MFDKISAFFTKVKPYLEVKRPWDILLIFSIALLLTIPVFIILHQNIIDFDWKYHLDRIVLFFGILILFFSLLLYFRRVTLLSLLLYLIILIMGTLIGDYGFRSVYEDYKNMLYAMSEDPRPQDIIISKLLPFPNKSKIVKAVEFENKKIRSFAIYCTTKHFESYKTHGNERRMVQSFAIFKEIQSRWNYVNDPKGTNYIASSSESLQYLSGDCDDYAILMAASIKSIGGTIRLIHTDGHIYPELLVGNQKELEKAVYLIKEILFKEESKDKTIHYHIDERKQIWLNLDYTENFPGGRFLSEEILGQLTL